MKARLLPLLAVLGLFAVTALAETAADLRQRMEQRLPQIDALKASEVLGENNRGFLELRQSGTPAASELVRDENRDREAVYAEIGQQTGAAPDAVGRARARQIAANSRRGVWVQTEQGTWVKK
ncbi:MAG: YdbL family protein [Opitutae bacterium]|nr:YdbL family protein [Opitutae bacterium]